MVLDMHRETEARRIAGERHFEQFWHAFVGRLAARTADPLTNVARWLPDLGLSFEDTDGEYPDEDKLPPPSPEEIADIEAWIAAHQHGTLTMSELNGNARP